MTEQYYSAEPAAQTQQPTKNTNKFVNYAGAAVSLALIVGVGVWGYKLMVRDVTGVPVVAAIDGPMRVAPEEPGGSQAAHQGLAVNNVAAEGEAAAPEDRLVLAPKPVELRAEDTPAVTAMSTAEAGEVAPVEQAPVEPVTAALEEVATPADPLSTEDVLALADRIAANVAPLAPLEPGQTEQTPTPAAFVPAVAPDVPGVSRSLRPSIRPASLKTVLVAPTPAAPTSAPIAGADEVAANTIAAGTRLVQLGAYDSAEVARAEWQKVANRFGEYMEGKQRVVQKASIGGKTFYRLRAVGFADLNDARRFCSALVAESAACIPVVAR